MTLIFLLRSSFSFPEPIPSTEGNDGAAGGDGEGAAEGNKAAKGGAVDGMSACA